MYRKLRLFIFTVGSCFTLCLAAQQREGMEYVIKDTVMLASYKSTIASLQQQHNIPELARSLKRIADYYYTTSPDDSALYYYKLALKQYEQARDSFHISYCYFRIGE